MGVRNRVSSTVIAGTELLVFALPFSVVRFQTSVELER